MTIVLLLLGFATAVIILGGMNPDAYQLYYDVEGNQDEAEDAEVVEAAEVEAYEAPPAGVESSTVSIKDLAKDLAQDVYNTTDI